MTKKYFQLVSARFSSSENPDLNVRFLGPSAKKNKSHITIIAGANGTSKSRIISSIVDELCEIESYINSSAKSKNSRSNQDQGLTCKYLISRTNDAPLSRPHDHASIPSKILVLSHLVMDRFRFSQRGSNSDFYHYLGVRQATNLTTTGSMQRSVSDAITLLYQNQSKRRLFQKWFKLAFGKKREFAITYERVSSSQIDNFLHADSPSDYLSDYILKRVKPLEVGPKEAAQQLTALFQHLNKNSELASRLEGNSAKTTAILRLNALSEESLRELSDLHSALKIAVQCNFMSSPKVVLKNFKGNGWTEFSQLSSGEQNILSTGAKIIAHAKPGCLIAIDEPEVSLNTAWQQHYTDLIRYSLRKAPGSHVLIATHSPHLISSLPMGAASVVLIERKEEKITTNTVDAKFEGWGAEAVLYKVLDIPSASNFKFQRDLGNILLHIQEDGKDKYLLDNFINTAERLNLEANGPLAKIISSIKIYREKIE